jgi:hypothetical protein
LQARFARLQGLMLYILLSESGSPAEEKTTRSE